MREIKFRAWDSKYGEMSNGFDRRYVLYVNFEGNIDEHYAENDGSQEMRSVEGLILMQYTGLKDKQGKEIYEGDIVRFIELERKEGSTMKQAFGKDWVKAYNEQIHLGEIKWNEKEARFYPAGKRFFDEMGSLFSWNELVVLGNIYETPELLK